MATSGPEDEFGGQTDAEEGDGGDLLRLDEKGDRHGRTPIQPERDGRGGVGRLEKADVNRRHPEHEAEVGGEECGDGAARGDGEMCGRAVVWYIMI